MTVRSNDELRLAALYGHPVSHSLSPAMQNAAFSKLRTKVIYVSLDVLPDQLSAAVEAARGLRFLGFNLTHPHKKAVMSLLDRIDTGAERIEAVNTVVHRDGILAGYNTDGDGFLRSLRQDYGFEPRGKRIVLFGTGGAGRAISHALSLEDPEELILVNRTFRTAQGWAEQIQVQALDWEDPQVSRKIGRADLVVNAAAVPFQLDAELISTGTLVYDIVYGQGGSGLADQVRRRGARWADGRSMLLHQGALAFALWTGRQAPVEVMREALFEGEDRCSDS
jgi:shikimate dehydrogenase